MADAEPTDVAPIFKLLFTAYADLWCRHRALLMALAQHGVVPVERFEADVASWIEANRARLTDEARDHFARVLVPASRDLPLPPARPGQ